MAVRIKVVITGPSGKSLETVAVLNGGFETEEPCVLLPARAAARVLDSPAKRAKKITADVAGGQAEFRVPPERVEVRVRGSDRTGPPTRCEVLISSKDREALLSDSAIDALGVKIESFRRGLWRFSDEDKQRSGDPPQHW